MDRPIQSEPSATESNPRVKRPEKLRENAAEVFVESKVMKGFAFEAEAAISESTRSSISKEKTFSKGKYEDSDISDRELEEKKRGDPALSPSESSAISTVEGSKGKRQTYIICGKEMILDVRYVPIKRLGSGAFGMVFLAKDEITGDRVAIKKIGDAFHSLADSKRILREMKILRHLQEHPNIISLVDVLDPLTLKEFEDLYLVFDHMPTDLHRIIISENHLTEDHIGFIVYQILCGLKYMHSANVIHRDLKPGNVLINSDCSVKICDLGYARGLSGSDLIENMTEYVVTRWYRAPEVMVSAQKYDFAIDLWSVGCIMAELFNRKPLFRGENYVDQLLVIFSLIGTPTEEDLSCVYNEEAVAFIRKLKKRKPKSYRKVFPTASVLALDLLSKFLVFDPCKRITVEEALRHPFLRKFYNEEYVKEISVCPVPFDFSFEKDLKSKKDAQELIFAEIIKFRPFAALNNPMLKESSEEAPAATTPKSKLSVS